MAGNLTAMIASIFSGSAVSTDPYFEYTTLLLPGNGTNGANNNTFLDGSTNNFTITRNGNTTQGTFSPFSQTGWGNYFDGGNKYLSFAGANTANAMGTGDWTFEAWLYPTTSGTDRSIFDTEGQGTITTALRVRLGTSNQLILYVGGVAASGGNVPANTWTHVAICKSSGSTRLFVNGSQVGSTYSDSNNYTCGVNRPITCVDGYASSTINFYGFISNLRVVKGQGLFTGTFTPSNLPLGLTTVGSTGPGVPTQNITGTVSLLTCQSNRFKDNSTNNFTTTVNGNPSVVALSPFNPTASWSAATNGGSGYFDGNGDYLTSSINAIPSGSTPFTCEAWIYPTAFSGTSTIFGGVPNIAEIQFSSTGISYNKAGVTAILSSSTALTLNAWNHIAVVRNGSNNSSILLNGVRLTTTASDSNTFSATTSYIGAGGATQYCFGYLSNVRFVVGTAVYDPTQTTYIVPTAPLTAITNTSLLLNFTNAGIYDATSKNDLETVGNAQISTAISAKWGSGSMYFDGTGDYLTGPTNTALNTFGTAPFTVEAWVYPTATKSANSILDTLPINGNGARANSYAFAISSSNKAQIFTNGAPYTSSGSISLNTWTHIAFVREGTGTNQTKIYINGVNDGTFTTTTNDTLGGLNVGVTANIPTDTNYMFQGYIQDLRITKGYARYTSNFTPPTAAFPTL